MLVVLVDLVRCRLALQRTGLIVKSASGTDTSMANAYTPLPSRVNLLLGLSFVLCVCVELAL